MMIVKFNNKYNTWEDGKSYILTARWDKERRPIVRGTLEDCRNFEEQHPYGITRKELEEVVR
jgi:hypothetical protein